MTQPLRHPKPPKLANERTGLNDKVANVIATTVGSMWMFYASIIGFAVWMAGLGVTVAGDYPYNLMLLAVGGIMQWLAMIAILVAQNAQGNVQDKQVEHLHKLGVTTHSLSWTYSYTWVHTTASKLSSWKGSAHASACSKRVSAALSVESSRAVAIASMLSLMSVPITAPSGATLAASSAARKPGPAPMSSTRSPGLASSARSTAWRWATTSGVL